MNWNALGAIGQIVAAVAVVVSIIYLSIQVRQNTQSIKLEVERNIALSLAKSIQDAALTTFPGIYVRTATDLSNATDEERAQFGFFVLGFFRIVQHAHDQRLEGNLSDRSWESIEMFFVSQIGQPGVRAVWNIRGNTFKREFQNYVNSLESDETHALLGDVLGKMKDPRS